MDPLSPSPISYESTILFASSLEIHYKFREFTMNSLSFREFTMNSLSFLPIDLVNLTMYQLSFRRIHFEFTICNAKSL